MEVSLGVDTNPDEQLGREEDHSDEPEFLIKVPGSRSRFDYLRIGAGVIAGLSIVGIILFSATDLSSVVLPMEDRYLDVMIPTTEEGLEPFVLNELAHEISENTLSVSGVMTNRSAEPVENVVAVITARETTGRFPATLEIPVDPSPILPDDSGSFSMSVTLLEKPDNYSIRFRIVDGPFVPHKDERGLSFEIRPPQ